MRLKKVADWVEETVDETLTYYGFPSTGRTNNPLERIMREINNPLEADHARDPPANPRGGRRRRSPTRSIGPKQPGRGQVEA